MEITKESIVEQLNEIVQKVSEDLYAVIFEDRKILFFEVYERRENDDQIIFRGGCSNASVQIFRWAAQLSLGELTYLSPYQVRKVKKMVKIFFEEKVKPNFDFEKGFENADKL